MIELPYPHKALWPNGRAHHQAKGREVAKHRQWAYVATLADRTRPERLHGLVVTLYPKPTGPVPDNDNIVAAVKSYQDGIAHAFGVDDRTFRTPRVIIAERCRMGKLVVDYDTEARPIGEIIAPIMREIAGRVE